MTLEHIKRETRADATLQEAAKIIRKNNWHSFDFINNLPVDLHELKLLLDVKNELTISNDTNLFQRGTRILIPRILRHDSIQLLHITQQGIVKTKISNTSKNVVPDD